MRDISRAVVPLLLSLLSLSQNSAGQLPAPDQNYILNLYDAFGYQKRGTILDWGFSALVRYNAKTILFDTGNSADGFEHNVKALGVDLNQVDIAVLSHAVLSRRPECRKCRMMRCAKNGGRSLRCVPGLRGLACVCRQPASLLEGV